MSLVETLELAPPVLFATFHVAEVLAPAEHLPRSFGWRAKGLLWFLISGAIFTTAPQLWTAWAGEHRLLDTSALGLWGALLALVVANFFSYWWHRARHRVPLLWRLHRVHHAAERLDISGAFLFHPLETLPEAFLFSVTSIVLGVSAEAAALAGALGFFCACFQHANLRTPGWLGYVLQRPEAHSVHHARGVHAYNYADLPIFDMLFGTFKQAERREPVLGLFDGSARRVSRLLVGLDLKRENGAILRPLPEGN